MELWSYPGEGGWYAPLGRTTLATATLDPLAEQLRHFLAVIAGREAPLISVEDAMRTLAVVEAVREAARGGGVVSPNQLVEQAA
jgi:predicted dehydrogenase